MNASGRPVALVTGAARRIGACIARTLHESGYDLVLHYRRSGDEATALAAALNAQRRDSATSFAADLAEDEAIADLVDRTIDRRGRLDALVNNASAFRPTPMGAITGQDWDELFASNARAPLFLCQAAAPALRARRGAIVNLLDIHAERPLPGHTVYVMAKAALAAMTLSLARELAPDVRVNGVAPGAILWPENGKSDSEHRDIVDAIPLQRTGRPEDVAGAVRYLLRDAGYVTGVILRVDGGRWLNL